MMVDRLHGRTRLNRGALLSVAMSCLAACGGSALGHDEVPEDLRHFVGQNAGVAGQITERSDAKFQVGVHTRFCVLATVAEDERARALLIPDQLERQLIVALEQQNAKRGLPPTVGNLPRVIGPGLSKAECGKQDTSVRVRFDLRMLGPASYRLSLLAWQGRAGWAASIGRTSKYNEKSRLARPIDGGPTSIQAIVRASIVADADDLTKKLSSHVNGDLK